MSNHTNEGTSVLVCGECGKGAKRLYASMSLEAKERLNRKTITFDFSATVIKPEFICRVCLGKKLE